VPKTGAGTSDVVERLGKFRQVVGRANKDRYTALDEWAYRRGVTHEFIRSGKPMKNGLSGVQWEAG
jgi:hypothetical protein